MKTAVLAMTLAAFACVACGGDEKKPPTAPTGGTDDPTANAKKATNDGDGEKPGDNPAQSQINISDEIRKACGISDVDAHFAFNSSNIREQDHKILGQLATCFTSGPLAGREMRLVGHADPRGEPEYNMVLGGKRADNVKGFIAKKGMNESKIATTSRGEMDATGTDEATWSKDRRVDVVLGD
ncbi:MAG: OmpA family protein [Myxococcales bacterium]|nr:OmpA family protein [Myxococcales bacterium]